MTKNQIDYQNLLLTKARDAVNATIAYGNLAETQRHNIATESEVAKHNRVAEEQAFKQLVINQQTADANSMNAYTNRINAQTNARNAETNRLNYYVNVDNAKTNRMNAYSNRISANAQMTSAQANVISANASMMNAQTNRYTSEWQRHVAGYEATTKRQTSGWQRDVAYQNADINRSTARSSNELRAQQLQTERARTLTTYQQGRESQSRTILNRSQTIENLMRLNLIDAQSAYYASQSEYYDAKPALDWVNAGVNILRGVTGAYSDVVSATKRNK